MPIPKAVGMLFTSISILVSTLGIGNKNDKSVYGYSWDEIHARVDFHVSHHTDCVLRTLLFAQTGVMTSIDFYQGDTAKLLTNYIRDFWSPEMIRDLLFTGLTKTQYLQNHGNLGKGRSEGFNSSLVLENLYQLDPNGFRVSPMNQAWTLSNVDQLMATLIHENGHQMREGLYTIAFQKPDLTSHAVNIFLFRGRNNRIYYGLLDNQVVSSWNYGKDFALEAFAFHGRHISIKARIHTQAAGYRYISDEVFWKWKGAYNVVLGFQHLDETPSSGRIAGIRFRELQGYTSKKFPNMTRLVITEKSRVRYLGKQCK